MTERVRPRAGGWYWSLGLLVGLAVLVDGAGGPGATAALGLLLVGPAQGRSLRGLVAAIGIGAVALGAIAWVVAGFVVSPLTKGLATGLGIAIGGGLGSVVWLVAVGEEETGEDETMTVDMAEATESVPGPEPADLFEANPDPILYVDATGDEPPVVLGANPAFAETFGGDVSEGTPLADAIPVASGREPVVEAVAAGESYAATHECETEAGTEAFHVRVVAIAVADRQTAYVTFGPVVGPD